MNTYKTRDIAYKDTAGVRFLYNTLPGRVVLFFLIRPAASVFFGRIAKSRASRFFIKGFIKRHGIEMNEYKPAKYAAFNDFFKREAKPGARRFMTEGHILSAPCDGKLTAYNITVESIFHIKNIRYTIADLIRDKQLAAMFSGGVCLIYRLTTDDYHRYAYIDDAKTLAARRIKGYLHTVRPIASERYKVYAQNAREYEVLKTRNFGRVVQMEIGAMFVGCVRNHKKNRDTRRRGEEKGYFEFGGSTVVMLFEPGRARINEEIFANTAQGKETVVKMGQAVGVKS